MATLRNTRIALIACSKLKSTNEGAIPAYLRYLRSPLFHLSYLYAKQWGASHIYIMSAKYGLIHDGEEIYNYDKTLSKMSREDRKFWALDINNKLEEMGRHGGRVFLVLAGKDYYRDLDLSRLALFGNKVELPLQGLTQGRRLSWLKQQTQGRK